MNSGYEKLAGKGMGASTPARYKKEAGRKMEEDVIKRHRKALDALRKSAEMYDEPGIDQSIIELTLASERLIKNIFEERGPEKE
ncbi:MAG TPA: hypothetical protein HA366_03205 [Candidatus Methanomethylophilaceae archaeon]|nr:hypothetical protein [Candidatus Methanomethylophilaceae archaeon]